MVLGAGPAGLLVGAACARRGLDVAVVDPDPARPWPNTYGVWADEADALGWPTAHRWSDVEVWLDDGPSALGCGYALVDNAALKQALLGEVGAERVVAAQAVEVIDGTRVRMAGGETREVAVVVDATGAGSPFVARPPLGASAFQVAYGIRARVERHPYGTRMRWMDLRFRHVSASDPHSDQPSFLYAMPFGPDRVFVQETSLVARPPLPVEVLEERLYRRLVADGVVVESVEAVERCRIPMDLPLPDRDQRVVAFGAAASLVHPASGYQVALAGRLAPRVAEAIAGALPDGEAAAHAAWQVIWPDQAVRARSLFAFGSEFLAGLEPPEIQRFFRAFFSLPAPSWRGYLSGRPPLPTLARTMLAVFVASGLRMQLRLARAAGAQPTTLIRSIAGIEGS